MVDACVLEPDLADMVFNAVGGFNRATGFNTADNLQHQRRGYGVGGRIANVGINITL